MRYIQRFKEGKMIYLAYHNKSLIFEIHENNTFIQGWDIVSSKRGKSAHFSTLEAAQNFCETTINILDAVR